VFPVCALLVLLGLPAFRAESGIVGKTSPAFTIEALPGPGLVRSRDFAGRLLVINFWASWCMPCKEEAPLFVAASGAFKGKVEFLGIDVLDGRSDALKFIADNDVTYPQAFDAGGAVHRRFRVTGVPETFFVDRNGRLVGHYVGAFHGSQLTEALYQLERLKPGATMQLAGRGSRAGLP
jgi:cytochrome c biogenesis protein CcmG/thiol:disulfide interchange protein DsbE